MASKIEFPAEEKDDAARDVISFPAKIDGERIVCRITYEALMSRFGATITSMLGTFKENRSSIEAAAYQLINADAVIDGILILDDKSFGGRR